MRGSPRSGGVRASAGLDEAGLSVPAHLRTARAVRQGGAEGIGREGLPAATAPRRAPGLPGRIDTPSQGAPGLPPPPPSPALRERESGVRVGDRRTILGALPEHSPAFHQRTATPSPACGGGLGRGKAPGATVINRHRSENTPAPSSRRQTHAAASRTAPGLPPPPPSPASRERERGVRGGKRGARWGDRHVTHEPLSLRAAAFRQHTAAPSPACGGGLGRGKSPGATVMNRHRSENTPAPSARRQTHAASSRTAPGLPPPPPSPALRERERGARVGHRVASRPLIAGSAA